MRVIAGSARSLKLSTPEGADTRPTTDRIKETLFNILQSDVPDSIVLDLCAGSGGLGIECLSRGAKHAYFVENNGAAFQCIQANIKFTKFEEKATLLKQDLFSALGFIQEKEVDLIFIDPPYHMGYEKKVLLQLEKLTFVTEETLIILEASLPANAEDFLPSSFQIEKQKKYKTNQHFFIRKRKGNTTL